MAGSAAVLEAAFPKGVVAPTSLDDELAALRTRFWLATSVHREPNNYAYFGDEQGRFFGLWRFSDTDAELRLRHAGSGPRDIARFSGINGVLQAPVPEQRIFDPRERPWYRAAKTHSAPTWTSTYIDFKTAELVATDLSLQRVNQFLKQLALSANGVALVVEANGDLIGVSRGANLQVSTSGESARLNAADSKDALVRPLTKRCVPPWLAMLRRPAAMESMQQSQRQPPPQPPSPGCSHAPTCFTRLTARQCRWAQPVCATKPGWIG